MDHDLGFLLTFLEEEFKGRSDVHIRPIPRAGTKRSPDLPQDYDPQSNDIHRQSGVRVVAEGREYIFPVDWIRERRFDEIQKQIKAILERL